MMTFFFEPVALAIELRFVRLIGKVRIAFVAHQPDVVLLADREIRS